MKKIMLAALALLIVAASFAGPGTVTSPDIRLQLHQSFQKNFPNASNIYWEEDQHGYAVEFIFQSVLTRITYDRKGRFTGSLRNYSEQLLPFNLSNKIRQEYPGQKIYGVTEVSTPAEVIYYIKLESAKNWTTVRVDNDGVFDVVEMYGRAQ